MLPNTLNITTFAPAEFEVVSCEDFIGDAITKKSLFDL